MADYKYALGIDLGMRNTHAYYLKDGHVKPVKIDGIDSKMPSVLYVGWSQKVYVGRKAVTKAVFNPHNMICSSKKYIGDNKTNKTWTLNGLTFTPTDVATEIMKEVYRRFVLQVGCNKEEKVGAVIGSELIMNAVLALVISWVLIIRDTGLLTLSLPPAKSPNLTNEQLTWSVSVVRFCLCRFRKACCPRRRLQAISRCRNIKQFQLEE